MLKFLDTIFQDRNFSKLVWFLVIHVSSSLLDISYINTEHSVISNLNLIENEYEDSLMPIMEFSLGVWTSALLECTLLAKDKKEIDLAQMIIHHIITISLILIAIFNNYKSFGIVVLAIHDISDCFVILCKLAARMNVSNSLLIPAYVSMLLSWAYCRFYLFGLNFIYYQLFPEFFYTTVFGKISIIFLLFLLMLHVYWFYLMLRLAFKKDRVKQFES
jgi:hypothetical protein